MRRLAVLALAGVGLAGLGGCGFTPLYATPGVASGLTRIQVVAPEGRSGFLLRQDLDDALGRDKTAAPLYRLEMRLGQNRVAHGLNVNDVAQRYEIDATVNFTLTDLASGKQVHSGFVTSEISYDSASQPYAGITAEQSTLALVAQDAATKIQADLAAWMAHRDAP
jgi:LPS-assembly lipoprotein